MQSTAGSRAQPLSCSACSRRAVQRGGTAAAVAPAGAASDSCALRARQSVSLCGAWVGAKSLSAGAVRATIVSHVSRRTLDVVAAARFPTERTYVMIKPDGVQRGLVGEIIGRFERKGFVLKGLKLFQTPKELAQEHYKDLSSKPFYGDLVNYIISGPVVAMVWEGPGVVKAARKLIGATNPNEAEPGTIRGDLAVEVGRNVVHGSDSVENGEREIGLWFAGDKLAAWEPTVLPWLREL